MKQLIFALAASVAITTFAADTKQNDDEEFLAETGGYVVKADPGNGVVMIANAQTKVAEKALARPASYLRFHAKLNITNRTVEATLADKPNAATMAKLGGTLIVFVKDDPKCDKTICVAPDAHFAVVNVAALNADEPGDEILMLRTQKAVMRALCILCGAGGSQYPNTLVGAFRDPVKDYERFAELGLPPDVFGRMVNYLKTLGVRPVVKSTYVSACRSGWAPKPTNKYQQAIWDKVHQLPTKPIKIEYNEKRDKGK